MSNRSIQNFLKKIEKELNSPKAGKETRKRMNSGIVHSFTMSVDDNIAQILDVLEKRGYPINEEVVTIVKQQSQELYDQTYRALTVGYDAVGPENVSMNPDGSFTAIIKDYGKGFSGKDIKTLDYFDRIKNTYKGKVNTIANKLNSYYESVAPGTFEPIKQTGSQGFLDLGHREGSEVAKEQVRSASAKIYNQFTSKRTKAGKVPAEAYKTLGFDLSALKKDLEELSKIEVSIESAATNRNTAEEKELKEELRKTIKNALEKLNTNPAEFEGSDSRIQIDRKRIIKSFKDGLKKNKKAKQKHTNTKINKSSGKPQKKSFGGKKHKKGKQRVASLGFNIANFQAKESEPRQTSQLRLMSLINQKLPSQVLSNMKPPRLENRTGRFAASARVTEITTTKQGFTSIAFTYEKNPYQVFEQGAGKAPWASEDRDPRKIIDQSIREIAKELIAERFYTRRV